MPGSSIGFRCCSTPVGKNTRQTITTCLVSTIGKPILLRPSSPSRRASWWPLWAGDARPLPWRAAATEWMHSTASRNCSRPVAELPRNGPGRRCVFRQHLELCLPLSEPTTPPSSAGAATCISLEEPIASHSLAQSDSSSAWALRSWFRSSRGTDSRRFRLIHVVARFIRRLRLNAEPVERGDALAGTFDHYFTESEIRDELEQSGFELIAYHSTPYGHALGCAR